MHSGFGYTDFIFIARTGRPLMPCAVNDAIYNIIDAYNRQEDTKAEEEERKPERLPKMSAHGFRHTACTNMAKTGMNVKALQYIMGHANCYITMDVYNHSTEPDDIRKEMDKMENGVNLV